jgi:hypothetical protein
MSRRKDVERVVRAARGQGFLVDRASDQRGVLNALARLKRAGLVWPPP